MVRQFREPEPIMSCDPPQVDRYPRSRGQLTIIIARGSRPSSLVRVDRFPDAGGASADVETAISKRRARCIRCYLQEIIRERCPSALKFRKLWRRNDRENSRKQRTNNVRPTADPPPLEESVHTVSAGLPPSEQEQGKMNNASIWNIRSLIIYQAIMLPLHRRSTFHA